MNWRKWFNVGVTYRPPHVRGEPRLVNATPESEQGVFVTPQSLVTFPVATAAIGLIWKGIAALIPTVGGSLWVPAGVSFLVGAFIFYVGISDPKANRDRRDVIIAIVVAIVNVFYLFASAAGIVTAVGNAAAGK
jgi:hypothetical protein